MRGREGRPLVAAEFQAALTEARARAYAPELLAALREQADFLASLHSTYRADSRLAARVEAHLTAARAVIAKVLS